MTLKELTKGSLEIIGEKELNDKLLSGKRLRIKHGVDPNTSQLHLGYIVNYRVMRRFQDIGHTVVLLLGDFTGRIGDPTDKLEARRGLDKETLRKNAASIVKLATKILDKNRLEIRYNSEWWDKIKLGDFLGIAKKVSAARLWERDMFEKRLRQKRPVWTHEFLYPILQAYDSVMIKSDLTIIGSDQKFNELLGRELQKEFHQDQQALVLMPILPGIDGREKMSQSLGNTIGIDEKPEEIYGKIMSMPDTNIISYLRLLTDVSQDEITVIKTEILTGVRNPRDVKMRLAREVVTELYSQKDALEAEEIFKKIFQKKELPDKMQTISIDSEAFVLDILVDARLAGSRSEARRLIEQGAIRIDDQVISDPMTKIQKTDCPTVLRKGKRFFVKLA